MNRVGICPREPAQTQTGSARPTWAGRSGVDASPRMTAQRAQIASMFGSSAWTGPSSAPPIQRQLKLGDTVIDNEYELSLERARELLEQNEGNETSDFKRLQDIVLALAFPEQMRVRLDEGGLALDEAVHRAHIALMLQRSIPQVEKPQGPFAEKQPVDSGPSQATTPDPEPKVVAPKFDVLRVSGDNKGRVTSALDGWLDYARQSLTVSTKVFEAVQGEGRSLGLVDYDDKKPGYYEESNVDYRRKYKSSKLAAEQLGGATTEIDKLSRGIKGSSDATLGNYFYASFNGVVEGVAETIAGTAYVSNIATHPYNIVPPNDGYLRVAGAAKSLIATIMVQQVEGDALDDPDFEYDEPELYALNNKVKQIYDHFGFKVDGVNGPVDRPRGPKFDEKKHSNPKTEWHQVGSMKMSEADARIFVRKVAADGYITLSPEVSRWLDA